MTATTITAESDWWRRISKALSLSCDASRESGDQKSFLACTHVFVDDERMLLACESGVSTTSVTAETGDPEVSFTGSDAVLIPTSTLVGYLGQMPSEPVELTISSEDGTFTVHAPESDITFSSSVVPISEDGMVPRAAEDFSDDAFILSTNVSTLTDAYRAGAVMARAVDTEAAAGQDPLSGAVIEVSADGAQIFSMATSASEQWVDAEVDTGEDSDEDEVRRCLSWPQLTQARLAVMEGDVKLGVGTERRLALQDDYVHLDMSTLAIGTRSDTLSIQTAMKVLIPAWEARTVSVSTPAKAFFAALGRAGSVKSSLVNIRVSDVSMTLSSSDGESFKQQLPCSTQWHDDNDHELDFAVSTDTVRKLSSLLGGEDRVLFEVAHTPSGKPWAMIVHGEDYLPDNPHGFFMLALDSARRATQR